MNANGILAEEQTDTGYYYGDVDISMTVDASDALIVLKHAAKVETIADGLPLALADITQDNTINSSDALEILKVAAKLSDPVLYVPDEETPDTEDPDVTDPTTTDLSTTEPANTPTPKPTNTPTPKPTEVSTETSKNTPEPFITDEPETTEPPLHEHQYTSKIEKEPTCTIKGTTRYTCSHTYVEDDIEPLGHDYQISTKTDPTCDDNGILWYKCARCTSTKSETIEKLGHAWIHHEEKGHTENVLIEPEYIETVTEPSFIVCADCGRDFGDFLGSASKARIHLKDVHGGGSTSSLEKEVWVEARHHDAWVEEIYEVRFLCQGCMKEFTAAKCGGLEFAEYAAYEHCQKGSTLTRFLIGTVHHDAYEEPTHNEIHYVCDDCGIDFGCENGSIELAEQHINAVFDDNCVAYTSLDVIEIEIKREVVYEDRYIIDEAAYDECERCGARK